MLAAAVAPIASAQVPQTAGATLRGQVYDSLQNTPLRGATVTIAGTDRTTTSDARGRFEIPGMPPGSYTVVVYHAALDSIGLTALSTRATVGTTDVVANLGVPSFATLWRAACGADRAAADSGFVYGTVRDATTQRPVANAVVSVSWIDVALGKDGQVSQKRWRVLGRSDARGSYGVCGIPVSAAPRIRASDSTRASGLIDLIGENVRVRRRDLYVGRADSTADRGTVIGVVSNVDGSPFRDARILLEDAAEARSDARGHYTIRDVPVGTRQLQVLAIGTRPVVTTVDVRPHDTTLVNIELRKLTTLDVVRVIGSATQRRFMRDFEERKRGGFGYFADSTTLGRVATMNAAFANFPSTHVVRVGNAGRFAILFPRGLGECVANLWIDGVRQNQVGGDAAEAFEVLEDMFTDDIAAVEIYPRALNVPAAFMSPTSDCGAIAVWTKRALNR